MHLPTCAFPPRRPLACSDGAVVVRALSVLVPCAWVSLRHSCPYACVVLLLLFSHPSGQPPTTFPVFPHSSLAFLPRILTTIRGAFNMLTTASPPPTV